MSYDEADLIFDEYEHESPELFYTVTRTPGIGASEDLFARFINGCDCKETCASGTPCSCLKFGVNYTKQGDALILGKNKLFGDSPVYECNSRCACFHFKNCTNRNVQFGPLKNLTVFKTDFKGLGLRTGEGIRSGMFICEYAGEVISLDEAKERQRICKKDKKMNYVFILKEHFENEELVTCVDPSAIGNIGRYINHSCEPNSAVVPVRVNNSVPWLCVFAIRDIQPGDEICYDYSGSVNLNDVNNDDSSERIECFCGSGNCKKWLPYDVNV